MKSWKVLPVGQVGEGDLLLIEGLAVRVDLVTVLRSRVSFTTEVGDLRFSKKDQVEVWR